jgi:ElaB/YqjD/DUF883 family membrane-anchored ribosome-binding protein
MFRQAGYSHAVAVDVAEIERRLHAIEKRLERVGGGAPANASRAVDRVGEVVATALSEIAERFRGGAGSVGDEAMKIGSDAAKFGNDALRRVSDEVKHRPLVALAIVAGLGVLLGLSSRRG